MTIIVTVNAKLLKEKRKHKYLTQAELGAIAGAGQAYICGIENGKTPSLAMMAKIAYALDCSIDELLIKEEE